MTADIAAHVFTALVVVVAIFQVALTAGAPWGNLTWGGKFSGRLPKYMRAVALMSVVLLVAFAVIVSVRAGVLWPEWQPISRKAVWGVVAYCALGVVANAITPSRWERIIWLPVALALFACSAIVAMN